MAVEINEIERLLDKVSSETYINVGFSDMSALENLKQVLYSVFKDVQKGDSDRHKESINTIKIVNKALENVIVDASRKAEKSNESALKSQKELADAIDRGKKDDYSSKAMYIKFLEGAGKAFKYAADANFEFVTMGRDLESAAVQTAGGFKSVYESATNAGMTVDEFSKHLQSSSPIISKLNAGMGDGVKVFSNALKSINDDYLMTHEQQVAVVNSYMEQKTAFGTFNKMSEEELKTELDQYAKDVKALSIATGKSVESIIKETDIRNKAAKLQLLLSDPSNMAKYQTLNQAGMADEDITDFLMGKPSAKLLAMRSQDAVTNDMLATMEKDDNWTADKTISTVKRQKETGIIDQHDRDVQRMKDHKGFMWSDSKHAEGGYKGAMVGNRLANMNTEIKNTDNKADKEMLKAQTDYIESLNGLQNTMKESVIMQGALTKGLSFATTAVSALTAVIAIKGLGGLITSGIMGAGGFGNIADVGSSFVGNKIKNKIGGKTIAKSGKSIKNIAKKGGKAVAKGGKSIAKLGGKALGKSAAKKIPGLGILAGLAFAGQRLMDGDIAGAGLETLSGISGSIPLLGTAASLGIDGYLAKRDYDKETGADETSITETTNQIKTQQIKKSDSISKESDIYNQLVSLNTKLGTLIDISVKSYTFQRNGISQITKKPSLLDNNTPTA